MFIDSSKQTSNEVARFWSPSYPATTGQCIEIFYHMYGADIGTLNIYIVETGGDVTKQIPDWTRKGDHDNKWLIARTVANTNADYQVVFEATVGGKLGDIAIDDFRIVDGSCTTHGRG